MRATGKTLDMTLLWIFLISTRFVERLCACKFCKPPDEALSHDTPSDILLFLSPQESTFLFTLSTLFGMLTSLLPELWKT